MGLFFLRMARVFCISGDAMDLIDRAICFEHFVRNQK